MRCEVITRKQVLAAGATSGANAQDTDAPLII
jgi:hypothetical protein